MPRFKHPRSRRFASSSSTDQRPSSPHGATDSHSADTSWQSVSGWYDRLVGQTGHYYHQQVIFPHLASYLQKTADTKVLDLGCGQGVLAGWLGADVAYLGVDAAKDLISVAQKKLQNKSRQFVVADVTQPLTEKVSPVLKAHDFSDVFCLLSLQNMKEPVGCLTNAAAHLRTGGKLHIVLNHPCFRIPRQTGWGEHPASRQNYRWINRYLTLLEVPIMAHPGQRQGPITWSYHHPLTDYSKWLRAAGLVITEIDEWTSDKQSTGKVAKQENLGRSEIPLFMYLQATKQ